MDWNGRGRSATGGSHHAPTEWRRPDERAADRGPAGPARSGRPTNSTSASDRCRPARGPVGPDAAPSRRPSGGTGRRGRSLRWPHAHRGPRARGRPGRHGGRAWCRHRADVPGRPAGLEEAAHPPPGRGAARRRRCRWWCTPRTWSTWPRPNNRIRIPSRKLVVQHAEGAAERRRDRAGGARRPRHRGRGHRDRGGQLAQVRASASRTRAASRCRCSSRTPRAATTRWPGTSTRWPGSGTPSASSGSGFCLDTCHAFAAGEDLVDVVERAKAITGRIDLVHLNNSRDEFGSARDRHANIADGTIDPDAAGRGVRRRRRAGGGGDAGRGPGRRHRVPA